MAKLLFCQFVSCFTTEAEPYLFPRRVLYRNVNCEQSFVKCELLDQRVYYLASHLANKS